MQGGLVGSRQRANGWTKAGQLFGGQSRHREARSLESRLPQQSVQ
jgi:hypothetical protein